VEGGQARRRLFCALRLPEPVVAAVAAWQREALHAGRSVPAANLHVTLAFLGSRPEGELPEIAAVLAAAAAASPRIALELRGYRETRRVGMLVFDDEGGRAAALAERVGRGLEALGVYRREARPFLPHLTVLRFETAPALRPALPALGPFSPSDAAVYSSTLRAGGARYEVLEATPLGG
jgi:2'-5' RNA ligase